MAFGSRTERDLVIKIEDLNGLSVTFKAVSSDFNDDGDWAIDGGEYDSEFIRHRGILTGIVKGDQQPYVVTATPHVTKFFDASAESWPDIVEWKTGGGTYIDTNWVPINGATEAGAASRFPEWKVTLTLEGSDYGGTDTNYVFAKARVTYGGGRFASGRPATSSIKIEAIPADVTRS